MTKLLRLLFSVHLIFPEIVVGWIQVGQSELNIRIKTKLLAQEVDEDSIDSYRSHLESSYAETNDALSDLDSKLRFNGRLEEVREVPYNRFNNLSTNPISDWSEYSACRGEECEQCEIPDEFKDQNVNIDVLTFLGIQRANPLQMNSKVDVLGFNGIGYYE